MISKSLLLFVALIIICQVTAIPAPVPESLSIVEFKKDPIRPLGDRKFISLGEKDTPTKPIGEDNIENVTTAEDTSENATTAEDNSENVTTAEDISENVTTTEASDDNTSATEEAIPDKVILTKGPGNTQVNGRELKQGKSNATEIIQTTVNTTERPVTKTSARAETSRAMPIKSKSTETPVTKITTTTEKSTTVKISSSPAKSSRTDLVAPDANKVNHGFAIANWHAPPEIKKNFPYYLCGYDHEDRAIVVIDIGKWDARAWHKRGKDAWLNLERHAEKMLYYLDTGIFARNFTDDDNITKPITEEMVIIVDFDNFNVAQITSPPAVSYMTKYLGRLEALQEKISAAYFVNVNAVASVLVRLLRPILGKAMERVEVFGTQKSRWMQVIRRNLPVDQIPLRYGGVAGHKPLVYFG